MQPCTVHTFARFLDKVYGHFYKLARTAAQKFCLDPVIAGLERPSLVLPKQ